MTHLPTTSGNSTSRWTSLIKVLRQAERHTRTGRPRRVFLVLLFILMVNLFDLTLTLLAMRIGMFVELNPIAQSLLGNTTGLIIFKLSMATVASIIFLIFRRHWFAELMCWVLFVIYTALAFIWLAYYATR